MSRLTTNRDDPMPVEPGTTDLGAVAPPPVTLHDRRPGPATAIAVEAASPSPTVARPKADTGGEATPRGVLAGAVLGGFAGGLIGGATARGRAVQGMVLGGLIGPGSDTPPRCVAGSASRWGNSPGRSTSRSARPGRTRNRTSPSPRRSSARSASWTAGVRPCPRSSTLGNRPLDAPPERGIRRVAPDRPDRVRPGRPPVADGLIPRIGQPGVTPRDLASGDKKGDKIVFVHIGEKIAGKK